MHDLFSQVALRLTTDADAEFLRLLFHDVRGPEFAGLGLPPASLSALLDLQFRAQSAGYSAQFPGAVESLVLRAGEPVGRVLLATQTDALHLVDFALIGTARGHGIGGFLLRSIIDQAGLLGLPVRLSVRWENPALRLYQRHGFQQVAADALNLTLERPAPAELPATGEQFHTLPGQPLPKSTQ